MSRPRPPYLQRHVTRHGRVVWYVRQGRGKRFRIRAEFGTPEFTAEYQAALNGEPSPKKGEPQAGTLAWLISRYREVPAWRNLSLATRKQRENIFKHLVQQAADVPFARITTREIIRGRDRRGATPGQARHFLQAMRGLFRWAVSAQMAKFDPTAGVDDLEQPKTGGFPIWLEEHIVKYRKRWPLGTRQRVWLEVLLYTGLRRGDAVQFGRQHVTNDLTKNGSRIARIKTEKTGTEVTIVIARELEECLAAGPCGDLAFIAGENGHPLAKESFGNLFRDACRAAGVPGSAHGLRKLRATRSANKGASVHQLMAQFGWTDVKTAMVYTEEANRRKLAVDAYELMNDRRTSKPTPLDKVRASRQKPK